MGKFFEILHSDKGLSISAFVSAAAVLVKAFAAPHTIAYSLADKILLAAPVLGISSTISREKKE